MDDRVDRLEAVDTSEACVFKERAETFRLGARLGPNGDDVYAAESRRFTRTFLLPGVCCVLVVFAVVGRDCGRFT